jgi:Spy/CpxP family protein refolding chaperone
MFAMSRVTLVAVAFMALLSLGARAQAQMGPHQGHGVPIGPGPKPAMQEAHEGCEHGSCSMDGESRKGGCSHDDDSCGAGSHGDRDEGECPMMKGDKHFEHLLRMTAGMGAAETARIKELVYEAQKQSITLSADLERAVLDLHHMMAQDKPDADAVLKQMDKAGQLKTELKKVHVRLMLEATKSMTPEQRRKFRERMH